MPQKAQKAQIALRNSRILPIKNGRGLRCLIPWTCICCATRSVSTHPRRKSN